VPGIHLAVKHLQDIGLFDRGDVPAFEPSSSLLPYLLEET
jgi:hypothetical protein